MSAGLCLLSGAFLSINFPQTFGDFSFYAPVFV